jgi:hypothetical protein
MFDDQKKGPTPSLVSLQACERISIPMQKLGLGGGAWIALHRVFSSRSSDFILGGRSSIKVVQKNASGCRLAVNPEMKPVRNFGRQTPLFSDIPTAETD